MRLSKTAQEVADQIDRDLYDCKEECKSGLLYGELRVIVIRTILKIMDEWQPRLNRTVRMEVLDWVQREYGICM